MSVPGIKSGGQLMESLTEAAYKVDKVVEALDMRIGRNEKRAHELASLLNQLKAKEATCDRTDENKNVLMEERVVQMKAKTKYLLTMERQSRNRVNVAAKGRDKSDAHSLDSLAALQVFVGQNAKKRMDARKEELEWSLIAGDDVDEALEYQSMAAEMEALTRREGEGVALLVSLKSKNLKEAVEAQEKRKQSLKKRVEETDRVRKKLKEEGDALFHALGQK